MSFSIFCDYRFDECTIYVLLFDNLLWNSRKVNSIQFRWMKTIIYRVICDEMFICKFTISVRIFRFCRNVLSNDLYNSQFAIVFAC